MSEVIDTSLMTDEERATFWERLYVLSLEELQELYKDRAEKAAKYRQAEFAMQKLEDLANKDLVEEQKRSARYLRRAEFALDELEDLAFGDKAEYKNRQDVGNDV